MKKLYFIAAILILLFQIGCSDKSADGGSENTGGTASLIVSLKGKPTGKAVGSSANPAAEIVISNLHVFVFHSNNGYLEKHAVFDGIDADTVKGLSTGNTKTVVAFVNVPSTLDLSDVTTYTDLQSKSIDLDSQNGDVIATAGLFMSGKTSDPITLIADQLNTVTIPVTRRVAKVVLKSLKVSPDASSLLSDFSLHYVSMQRARMYASPIDANIAPTGDINADFAGGIASPAGAAPNFTLVKPYLMEAVTIPPGYVAGSDIITDESLQRYFYVLPNDGTDYSTLLTMTGTYASDDEVFYPFVINGTTGTGTTNGKFIESNNIYEISVNMVRLSNPSNDPNEIPSDVALEVIITQQPWETPIDQPVEW